ncbi:MAG TPA: SUMF1/EgtB/PvdO family nonheme iron enzyme, partial [bacterium]|nr:SUMF1/EgtB/PvdO family nonheme iron enzyme [bacterium]
KEIPTEEQWEKAARGKNNYLYAFGNKFNKEFAYVERSINDGLIKIGSYKPNDYGLYDMTGLVWEWTKSKFEPYDKNSNDKKEYNENYKVLKGGCWLSGKDHCRNSFRFYYKPELRTIFTGCRFILTMQKIESIINKSE